MVDRWVKAFQDDEGGAFRGNAKLSSEKKELRHLRAENRRFKTPKRL